MFTAVSVSPYASDAESHFATARAGKRTMATPSFTELVTSVTPTPGAIAFSPAPPRSTTAREHHALKARRVCAARRIQSGWRAWQDRIQAAKRYAVSGQQYVKTTSYPQTIAPPSPLPEQTRQRGMINFTPIAGNGPTLSVYKTAGDTLGIGSEAVVLTAPRGFVERLSKTGAAMAAPAIAPARYADLTSFQTTTHIDDWRQIGRNAGTNLHDYLYRHKGVLSVRDFELASNHLKRLHQRGLYHLDIKLDNMTVKVGYAHGEHRGIYFIDCEGITERPEAPHYCTYFRDTLAPASHRPVATTGRADDEYAFLLVLLHVADFSFASLYRRLWGTHQCISPTVRQKLDAYLGFFVEKYVKPAYRAQVKTFITAPIDAHALPLPLHDVIDWSAPPDLICALQRGNLAAIYRLGRQALEAAATREQQRDLLVAKNAIGYPGLYWALKSNDMSTQQQWYALHRQLPSDIQTEVLNRIDRLFKEKNA